MPQASPDSVSSALAKVFGMLLTAAWLVLLAILLLLGGLLALAWTPKLWFVALGLTAATGLAALVRYGWRRYKLGKLAKVSLVARAQRDGLSLDSATTDQLREFDEAFEGILEVVGDESFRDVGMGLAADSDARMVQTHLYQLVRTMAQLRRDITRLQRKHRRQTADMVTAEMRDDLRTIHDKIAQTTQGARQLWERLLRVRQVAHRPSQLEAGATDKLESMLEELDRAVSAFREVDQSQLVSAQNKAKEMLNDVKRRKQEAPPL